MKAIFFLLEKKYPNRYRDSICEFGRKKNRNFERKEHKNVIHSKMVSLKIDFLPKPFQTTLDFFFVLFRDFQHFFNCFWKHDACIYGIRWLAICRIFMSYYKNELRYFSAWKWEFCCVLSKKFSSSYCHSSTTTYAPWFVRYPNNHLTWKE